MNDEPLCNCPLCGRTHRKMPFGKPPPIISEVSKDNATYLREWAADIRKHSGKSVDADRCEKIADEIAILRRDRDAYRRVTGQMTNPHDTTADIVDRLRHEHIDEWGVLPALLMADAADEIEKLRGREEQGPRVMTAAKIKEMAKDPRVKNAVKYPDGQDRYPLSERPVCIPRAQYKAYKAAAKLIMTRAGLRYEPENECPCWDCEYARVLAALRAAGIHETGGEHDAS